MVAISGFYVGLYVVFKGLSAVFSSPKKEEVGENHGEKHTEGRVAHGRVHNAWKMFRLSRTWVGRVGSCREKDCRPHRPSHYCCCCCETGS